MFSPVEVSIFWPPDIVRYEVGLPLLVGDLLREDLSFFF